MQRVVSPEWLDELPSDDPRARRSRNDLQRINSLMGHAAFVAGILERALAGSGAGHLVELGAGDGTFLLEVLRRLPRHVPIKQVTLVDRAASDGAEARAGFAGLDCAAAFARADVFDWLNETREAPVILANLFLHHFPDADLARLLRLAAARTRIFIACEPHRSWLSLSGSRLLGLIGCNAVTRHDAVISVRAGFAGDELSRLWPKSGVWLTDERERGLFSHTFAARRLAGK